MITIQQISAAETHPIRLEVLRKNIPLPHEFKGDLDNDTFHLGAFKNGTLIAVSSYMQENNKNFKGKGYQLRGMATLPQFQGLSAGKLMLEKATEIMKLKNTNYLWCNARLAAVDFYKKQGLQTYGELFDIQLVGPHYVMYKILDKNE
jgi:ribosomal protein S18 acetylase RimI-like enzyme